MNARVPTLTCVFVSMMTVCALAQDIESGGRTYIPTIWTEREGLPSGRIWSIAQDAEGYLWLGTDAGLVRFDGSSFQSATEEIGWDLPHEIPSALLSARDGSLWVGFSADAGIARVRGGVVEHHDVRGGPVMSLFEDSRGDIWAGNRAGVHRLRGERWQHFGGAPARAFYEDHLGAVWIAANDGLVRWTPEGKLENVAPAWNQVWQFARDVNGTVWIVDSMKGLTTLPQLAEKSLRGSKLASGRRLLADRYGTLWVGTMSQGLWTVPQLGVSGWTIDPVGDDDGEPHSILALLEDRDGNVWVGTEAGLHRLSPRRITAIPNLASRAVAVSPDDTVWVGTYEGLFRFAQGDTRPTSHEPLVRGTVTAMFTDQRQTIWAALGADVFQCADGRCLRVHLPARLRLSSVITSLATDARGSLWVMDFSGLFIVRDGKAVQFEPPAELREWRPTVVWADSLGRVWIGFGGSRVLLLNQDGTREVLQLPSAERSITPMWTTWTFHESPDRAVWIGGPHGLSRFHRGRLDTVAERHGLRGTVSAIAVDSDQVLWLAVGSFIVHLEVREFERAVAHPSERLRYDSYGAGDGVAGKPIWFGIGGAARAADGRILFVTSGGITIVDPFTAPIRSVAGRVRIDRATANDRRMNPASDLVLPAGTSALLIQYGIPNVSSPDKDRFKYRLEGLDSDWREAGQRRTAVYTNVPPGRFRFVVVANPGQGPNESSAAWQFSIEPFFYQTTWFRLLGLVVVVGAVVAAWHLRLKESERRAALVLDERTRVSREIHDTILQGLVGVTLQLEAITSSADHSRQSTRQRLTALREFVEDYIREVRTSVQDLRSPRLRYVNLEAALRESAEAIVSGSSKRLDITVSGTPPSESRIDHELLRIAQEALLNAVRHSGAESIRVNVAYDRRHATLQVSDDGSGFDMESAANAEGHFGLRSIRERAERIGGHLEVETAPGRGTKIEVVVPVVQLREASIA